MANSAESRKPSASVQGENTDSVSISWSLPVSSGAAGCPFAKYSSHPEGGAKVITPTAAELLDKIQEAQQAMFSTPEEKILNVNDGINNYVFSGFLSGAYYEILVGGVNNGKSITHPCARLQKLNTQIYVYPINETGVKSLQESGAGTITDFLKSVLNKMIDSYENSSDDSISAAAKAIRDSIHKANKEIINNIWFKILDNSTIDIEGFSEFIEDSNNSERLIQAIQEVYMNQSPDFFVKADQFSAMFQMMLVPAFKDTSQIGKFIPYSEIVTAVGNYKTVSIGSINVLPGERGYLPYTAVAMSGLGNAGGVKSNSTATQTIIATWPEEINENTLVNVISTPPWIPSDIQSENEVDLNAPPVLDLDLYASSIDEKVTKVKIITDGINKLAKAFCRNHYSFVALSGCTATISTLLDFTWEPGQRYIVTQDGSEEVLFSGFLRGVEHRLSSSPGKTSASTMLTFGWVEAKSFSLPNK